MLALTWAHDKIVSLIYCRVYKNRKEKRELGIEKEKKTVSQTQGNSNESNRSKCGMARARWKRRQMCEDATM